MERITPNTYIKLQKKLCNAKVIITANRLAAEWGLTPVDACYRVLTDALMREYNKKVDEKFNK